MTTKAAPAFRNANLSEDNLPMTTGDELSFGRQTSQPCQPDEARDASEDSDGSAELEA